ncbi:four-carbon acid sugar kinase family protein [Pseudarthrobacter equi]|uniref:four-carbon acid sugar kinase family protein n=1 Tax=Pseudarthrobacter equi TaxID=728066 RepID=UPI0021C1493D|nr:four-carbon acid sugar kinase family protein [Pseudarthrobacter equi]
MSTYVIADDLSGAAEAAAVLAGLDAGIAQNAQAGSVSLELISSGHTAPPALPALAGPATATVVDSGNRHLTAPEAAARMRLLLAARPAGSDVFLKFDSLLRGNLDAELAAALETGPVAFCPALPHLGRTVRNGVLEIKGTPLHLSTLWQAEPTEPGHSLAAHLPDTSPAVVPLGTVRGGELAGVLSGLASEGQLAVCDAETEDDLDMIAAAALSQGVVLAGASSLAAALRRSRVTPSNVSPASLPYVKDCPVLFILGTASPSLRAQLAELELTGIPVHRVQPADIPSFDPGCEGPTAIVVEGAVDPSRSDAIVKSLAELARRSQAGRHLVLSGGETARAVLDALGISTLHPIAQAHPGAVVSVTGDGRLVATRPGSFGDRHSLTQILTTMQALVATKPGKVSL